MALRFVGCTLLATWIGAVLGLLMAIPVMGITWGLSMPVLMAVGGTAGFLSSVLALADPLGPFGHGSGQWIGAAASAGILTYGTTSQHEIPVFGIAELPLLLGLVAYTAGVGFIAGRYAERSARSAVANQ